MCECECDGVCVRKPPPAKWDGVMHCTTPPLVSALRSIEMRDVEHTIKRGCGLLDNAQTQRSCHHRLSLSSNKGSTFAFATPCVSCVGDSSPPGVTAARTAARTAASRCSSSGAAHIYNGSRVCCCSCSRLTCVRSGRRGGRSHECHVDDRDGSEACGRGHGDSGVSAQQ